jgi:hypothetical protein
MIFCNISYIINFFFEILKCESGRAHPGESKNALRVVGGAWGAELRRVASREIYKAERVDGSRQPDLTDSTNNNNIIIIYRTVQLDRM